jgi:hypothetical protein
LRILAGVHVTVRILYALDRGTPVIGIHRALELASPRGFEPLLPP